MSWCRKRSRAEYRVGFVALICRIIVSFWRKDRSSGGQEGAWPPGLEILSIVPLQRAKRTPLWSLQANQLRPTSSELRPQAYIKRSAVGSSGHWHKNNPDRYEPRTGFTFFTLSFQPSFIFSTETMADTKVDSGSDISAKVSLVPVEQNCFWLDPPLTTHTKLS